MSRRSKIRKQRAENPGPATGLTKPEPLAKWGEQLDNAVESPSFDTIATGTELSKSPLSEPTSFASSTTETSLPPMADKLVVASYQPGEPLRLRPEHLQKLTVLAKGLSVSVANVIERTLYTILTPNPVYWQDKTVGDAIDYYLANFYYA